MTINPFLHAAAPTFPGKDELITWTDVESTGLSAQNDAFLEVSAIVTNGMLEEVGEPFEYVIQYTPEEVERLKAQTDPYVLQMHTTNGLWDRLPEGRPLAEVDEAFMEWVKSCGVTKPRSSRIGGNSVTLDRNFMEVNMPLSYNHLHYRTYDMSSVTGFLELYFPLPEFQKSLSHRALDDIRESIAQARYARDFLLHLAR